MPEQHGFELHRSTYMWIFLNGKYYSTTQSTVVKFEHTEPQIWRNLGYREPTVNYVRIFNPVRVGALNLPIFQGSTVYSI